MLFNPGRIVATPGALEAEAENNIVLLRILGRHLNGDWGDLCKEDKQTNDDALIHGGRIFSAYILPNGTKIWIITEADYSVTTFLLPEEY